METASSVIVDALQELLVQASEAPIEADEAQTALRYLNRMMAEFDSNGISLGYTNVSNLGDVITVPDGALGGIVTNLAIKLAAQYQKEVPASLVQSARDGVKAMLKLSANIIPTSFPDSLPVGSGNQGDSILTDKFYSGDPDAVLNETGNFISTEIDTELP